MSHSFTRWLLSFFTQHRTAGGNPYLSHGVGLMWRWHFPLLNQLGYKPKFLLLVLGVLRECPLGEEAVDPGIFAFFDGNSVACSCTAGIKASSEQIWVLRAQPLVPKYTQKWVVVLGRLCSGCWSPPVVFIRAAHDFFLDFRLSTWSL